jgi:glycerol-3-phosphate dehydrogenase
MDALHRLPAEVQPRRRRPDSAPLGRVCADELGVDPAVAADLRRLYGGEAGRVAAYADGLDRIDPRGPDIWAQVDFARDEEWALTVDDVVARRTTLAVRGLATASVRDAVGRRLATREPARA